jgi:DNA primase
MIPESTIEEIRDRVDVVAVIGRHMELKRSGRTWKGCCVFHGERTPSFHVYPEDKHFKCYGCGEYGDVFKFLQKLQGKEFRDVVRELAAEVGVEIPAEEEESSEVRQRRLERNELTVALDAAARYFAARLWSDHGRAARDYLARRGVREEIAKLFRVGVSSSAWNDLAPRLRSKGVGESALSKAGLIVDKAEGKGYDRFRGRLMFPIAGLDSQVIGFGGRMLAAEKGAKYINSPETLVYKKSRVLYGIEQARESIRKTRSAVLVEGYFDVIGLHQAGVKNAVAVCGTALTPEHVELLKRCDCREVTVLFDGDSAGQAAPAKAAQALLPSGISGKVAVLPSEEGKRDPDEFAREKGREAVEALLAGATPLTDFLIDRALASIRGSPDSFEGKLAAVRELEPFVRMAPEGLARSVFEERIAKRLALDLGALRAELQGGGSGRRAAGAEPARDRTAPKAGAGMAAAPAVAPQQRGQRVKILLPGPAVDALALMVTYPDLIEVAMEEDLVGLLPAGPLADLARELMREPFRTEEALARASALPDERLATRIRGLAAGAALAKPEAEREFRRAATKARVERVEAEWAEVAAQVTRAGTPAPQELAVRQLALYNRRRDLNEQLKKFDRG